ncbi:MAG: hypothetical protein NVS3B25_21360 [Hymenobacter sp.]
MEANHDYFWDKVAKLDGCWEWQGPLQKGYGRLYVAGGPRKAHHLAYELAYGAPAPGYFPKQTCRNKRCCKPSHLQLVYSGSREQAEDDLAAVVRQRFFDKADPTPGFGPNGDCWRWTGAITNKGYGNFWNGTKQTPAHRYAWETEHGPMPDHLFACHSCDERGCVNPAHIFAGSAKDNTQDMIAKGRKKTNGYDQRTHCLRGHALSGDNLRKTGNGTRQCKTCSNEWSRAKRAQAKQLTPLFT